LIWLHIFEGHLVCLKHEYYLPNSFLDVHENEIQLVSVILIYTDMLEAVGNRHSALF